MISHSAQRRRRGAKLIPGLLAWLSQRAALEGALATVPSLTGGAAWLVDATASKRPVGTPLMFEMGAQPALRLNGGNSQYVKAPGVVGDWPIWHKDDFTVAIDFISHQWADIGALFTTWGGSTSNECAVSLELLVTEQLQMVITSTTGGGTTHLFRATAAGTVRPGDRCTAVWRRETTTSRLSVLRRGRFPGDPDVVLTDTGTITGTPANAAEVSVPVLGAYRGLASGFATADVLNFMPWNRSLSDAEVARVLAQSRAWSDFPLSADAFVANDPLLIQAGGDLGAVAGDGADNLHPNFRGHAKVGGCAAALVIDLAEQIGIDSGTANRGAAGDSRGVGFNSDADANVWRAVCGDELAGEPFVDEEFGPNVSQGGHHTCVSGAVDRTLPGSPNGLSPRSPSPASFDRYFGVAPAGGDFNATQWMLFWCGVNLFNRALVEFVTYDNLYERWLSIAFIRAAALDNAGINMGIGLLTEPSSAQTTTGPAQREAFAFNRGLERLRQYALAGGVPIAIANLHNDAYHP